MTLEEIIEAVGSVHGFGPRDIRGTGRMAPLVRARQQAMCIAQERTNLSLSAIGRAFHRDHTTVIHGVARHKARPDRADADAAVMELLVPPFRRRPEFVSVRGAGRKA